MNKLFSIIILIFSVAAFSCSDGEETKTKEEKTTPVSIKTDTAPVVVKQKRNDSIPDGPFERRYPNGVIQIRGHYQGGVPHGAWTAFYPSGKLESEGHYRNGKRDGIGIIYHENGKIKLKGEYKNGRVVGVWKTYNSDGTLADSINYGQ